MSGSIAPSTHRYTISALSGDGLRALAGLAMCLFVLLVVGVYGFVLYLFIALAALFAAYGLQLLERLLTRIELDAARIRAVGPRNRDIAWSELAAVKLHYYRNRRRGRDGWLQLKLKSRAQGSGTLTLDSHLDGFESIARAAHAAAIANKLALSGVTQTNFAAIGIGGSGWGAPQSWGGSAPTQSEPA